MYSHGPTPRTQEQEQPNGYGQVQKSHQMKPYPGKRKVWGTMKICSSITVKRVISQLTLIETANIQVKRTYKVVEGGKGWHVVSGDESTMAKLEEQ